MGNFLSKKQIRELKADHSAERESRYADRVKSVLMLNSGYTASEIGKCLLLSEKSVRTYRDKYLCGGLEELCSDSYQGRASSLSKEEEAQFSSGLWVVTSR